MIVKTLHMLDTPYLKVYRLHLNCAEIRTNLKDMSHLKLRLFDSTTAFQKALLSMLINRASRDRSNLDQILNDVIDCHKTMGIIHQEQSKADDLIIQLAVDYERLVSTAKLVLSHRKLHQVFVGLATGERLMISLSS